MFRTPPFNRVFVAIWERPAKSMGVEGINLQHARSIKNEVGVPVLFTGEFQTASFIPRAIRAARSTA